METVGAYEAKDRLSELIVKAERGETTIITRNGQPVAQIGPYTRDVSKAEAALERIRSYGLDGRGLDYRELVESGRRY